MTRTRLVAVLIVLLAVASGYGLFEAGASQRQRPSSAAPQTAQPRQSAPPPQTAQPRQSAPPPQAGRQQETAPPRTAPPQQQPGEGRTRPPGTPPSGQAERRPPSSGPGHPGHPGHGGVVVPYPGYGWGGWYGYPWYPYAYPWGYPLPESIAADWMTSSIKIDVSPKDAALHVDGYYAGIVGDFGGFFHQLTLTAGPHHVEIRKAGYHTLVLDVNLQPGQTITYKRTMEPVQPIEGAPEEPPVLSQGITGDPEQFVQIPGSVRFDVTPKDAEVYADGYYAGLVDDFSGNTQRLLLTPGAHHIELRAKGYESVEFDVNVQPGQPIDYRNSLTRSR